VRGEACHERAMTRAEVAYNSHRICNSVRTLSSACESGDGGSVFDEQAEGVGCVRYVNIIGEGRRSTKDNCAGRLCRTHPRMKLAGTLWKEKELGFARKRNNEN
jgi:hypothetical protein